MCKKIEEKTEYELLWTGDVHDNRVISYSAFRDLYPIFYRKVIDNLRSNRKNGICYFYKEIIITPVYVNGLLTKFKIEQVGQN